MRRGSLSTAATAAATAADGHGSILGSGLGRDRNILLCLRSLLLASCTIEAAVRPVSVVGMVGRDNAGAACRSQARSGQPRSSRPRSSGGGRNRRATEEGPDVPGNGNDYPRSRRCHATDGQKESGGHRREKGDHKLQHQWQHQHQCQWQGGRSPQSTIIIIITVTTRRQQRAWSIET